VLKHKQLLIHKSAAGGLLKTLQLTAAEVSTGEEDGAEIRIVCADGTQACLRSGPTSSPRTLEEWRVLINTQTIV